MNRRNIIKTVWASLFGGATAASAGQDLHADKFTEQTADAVALIFYNAQGLTSKCGMAWFLITVDEDDSEKIKEKLQAVCLKYNIPIEFYGSLIHPEKGFSLKCCLDYGVYKKS